jgi:rhodanese-related sulfurtransferase
MSFHELYLKDIYELYQNQKEQYTWIDVRRPEEWAMGTIPEVERIVLDDLPEQLSNLDASKSYILICRSGGRSGQACRIMAEAGIKNVTNFGGGMLSWYEAGYPLEK